MNPEPRSAVLDEARPPGGGLLDRVIGLISSIFMPVLGILAGTGLLKAFLALAFQLEWLIPGTDAAVILSATADAFFFALPVMLAYTAARRFGAHVLTALTLASAVLYPALMELLGRDTPVFLLGLPVARLSYANSVLPIVLAVFVLSRVERVLHRWVPGLVREFLVPPLALLIMVPLTLMAIGPVTMAVGAALGTPINWLFTAYPPVGALVAGGVFGGGQQLIQIFGLHWGIIPLMIQEVNENGYSLMLGPIFAAVMGQSAAALAVTVRARSPQLRARALSASIAGFLAGVTEPALYGVNVPLKRPLIAGCIGGAIGGVIIAAGRVTPVAFVFPGLLSIPAFLTHGSLIALLAGGLSAIGIGFGLTLALGFREPEGVLSSP